MNRPLLVPALLLLLAAACTSADGGSEVTGPTSPTGETQATGPTGTGPTATGSTGSIDGLEVELEPVATLEEPTAMAVRAGDPALYVAEKTGRVVALVDGQEPKVVLDLSGVVSRGSEQGLLGIAFSPDGRFLYADLTDAAGDTRLFEFPASRSGVIDPDWRQVLRVQQPYENHNGGAIAFGPDGYLYIALGDGGSGGDPHGNGQALDTLLGKILRISPRPEGGEPYGIPPDNPFVGRADARPEIWAFGMRNPWRFSFDSETGDLWIGDVGQDSIEEVNFEPAGSPGGLDYGWNLFEGSHPFSSVPAGVEVSDLVMPVYEYPHDGSTCVVTGGYVYRGQQIPSLAGVYVFADLCVGRLQALTLVDGRVPAPPVELGPVVDSPASFGQDAEGELYVLSLSGDVYRIVPAGS